MFPPSAWRDEEVETLTHIDLLKGNYTTVNGLLGKTKCPKGKIAVYEEVVKTNKIITFRRSDVSVTL